MRLTFSRVSGPTRVVGPYEKRQVGGTASVHANFAKVMRQLFADDTHPSLQETLICKIWYSISQTVSDLGSIYDRSIRAFAVKPRAYGAPLRGFGA